MSRENVETADAVRIAIPPLSEGASRHRSLDERLYVRIPAVYWPLAHIVSRLPPRSRIRRALITRRTARAYAATNRRDYASVLVGWDPESEYRPSLALLPPDQEAVFYGHDGMRKLWEYWRDAFEDIQWDPEEVLDMGERFLVTAQQKGHGSGSGIAVSQRVFQLFTLRRGLVVSQEDFLDRSKALEAAGLSE